MTDKELLELAAKAAGIGAQWDCPERGMMVLAPSGNDTMTWNPLINDGDALRLAVKLGMGISIPLANKRTDVVMFSNAWINVIEAHDGDPLVATRRAIVRAAAEVGRKPGEETRCLD